MKYNLLICDDNIYEIEIIYSYIEKIFSNHQIELEINKFIDVEQALEYAKSQQIDIALLDIDMGQGKSSGISLAANLLKKNPEIVNIFVTGEMVTIPEVFSVRAFDYIQKPINPNSFKTALFRAINQVNGVRSRKKIESIVIIVDNLKMKIITNNIIYIERIGTRSRITTVKETFFIYETLKSLSSRLSTDFIQINQSTIVNINRINDYVKDQIIMCD